MLPTNYQQGIVTFFEFEETTFLGEFQFTTEGVDAFSLEK